MSSNETSTSTEVYITIDGQQITLVFPADWTYAEAKLGKAVSEGLAPDEITERLLVGDPDAGMAILRVSYHRAGLEFPQAAVLDTAVSRLGEAIAEADRRVRAERPPTSPSASGSTTSPGSSELATTEAPGSETTT